MCNYSIVLPVLCITFLVKLSYSFLFLFGVYSLQSPTLDRYTLFPFLLRVSDQHVPLTFGDVVYPLSDPLGELSSQRPWHFVNKTIRNVTRLDLIRWKVPFVLYPLHTPSNFLSAFVLIYDSCNLDTPDKSVFLGLFHIFFLLVQRTLIWRENHLYILKPI